MNKFREKHNFYIAVILLIIGPLILTACAKKAKMIQVGAIQFEAESLAAIDKIDEFRRKEIEAPPISQEEASALFVESIKNSTTPVTLAMLRIIVNPLSSETPASEAQWQTFLQRMRQQYSTFASVFASLDRGALLAASDVKEAVPILDKLIAQMGAFAESIRENPAEFIRERAAIAVELELERSKRPFTEVTNLKLLELERLRETAASEEQITRDTIKQALKAATLGVELRKLLVNYEKLNMDDITEGLSIAFKLAGGIPGADLSRLQAETDALVATINSDEGMKRLFDTALSEISSARDASK